MKHLLGRPWRAPGDTEPANGLDCRAVVVEALHTLGFERASLAMASLNEPDDTGALVCVGHTIAQAEKTGDVIYTENPCSVYVIVEPSTARALTSAHDHGVCFVPLRTIKGPLSVWRPVL